MKKTREDSSSFSEEEDVSLSSVLQNFRCVAARAPHAYRTQER